MQFKKRILNQTQLRVNKFFSNKIQYFRQGPCESYFFSFKIFSSFLEIELQISINSQKTELR